MKLPANAQSLIETLQQLRDQHGFRAETLVPDIAFVGLVDDCIDAALTAIELLHSSRPYRAYSLLRVAFEAAQRLLPLATSPDYIRLGTRAWLYYRRKDAALAGDADDAIGPTEEQMLKLWATHYPSAHQLVLEKLAILSKLKGPDNFLGRNLADVATESYSVLAAEKGSSVPSNATDVNRALYRALSRETHACVRLEPSELRVDADGFVEVVERFRDPAEVAHAVARGLEVVLSESIAAVQYRLSQRRRAHAAQLIASLHEAPLPPGYLGDIGRLLAEKGLGHTEVIFPGIPIQHIRELPDGTLSSSLTTGFGTEARMATFDFKGHARREILTIISEDFPEVINTAAQSAPLRIDLPNPVTLTIKAALGREQHTGIESFVPFIVTEVTRSNLAA